MECRTPQLSITRAAAGSKARVPPFVCAQARAHRAARSAFRSHTPAAQLVDMDPASTCAGNAIGGDRFLVAFRMQKEGGLGGGGRY